MTKDVALTVLKEAYGRISMPGSRESIDNKIDRLTVKLEALVGDIKNITITEATVGEHTLIVEGTKDVATVKIVLIGGYNIQSLHLRVTIKLVEY